MDTAAAIRTLCGENPGACDLDEIQAQAVFGALLDGGAGEAETAAWLALLHRKGASLPELIGCHQAIDARVARLPCWRGDTLPVTIPSYSVAEGHPNLLPLIALLLKRFGIPVLIHGELGGDGHGVTARVLRALDILPCATVQQAGSVLERGGVAFLPGAAACPGLARLMALRHRIGIPSVAHLLAPMIDPFEGGSLRVVGATGGAGLEPLAGLLAATGGHALLLQTAAGEAFANAHRRPRIELFRSGTRTLLFEAEAHGTRGLAHLPQSLDAEATARWIRRALAGEIPLPMPIVNELACVLHACGYSSDMNRAKAIAAVETGSLAA